MGSQWLIVGLGNPGAAYRGTRHNAGRMLVERLAEKAGTAWERKPALKAELARIEAGPSTNLLCKPLVYMNVSGEAVGAAARYFRIPPERVLVCVDDADLPLGVIRLRPGGGTGGHSARKDLRRGRRRRSRGHSALRLREGLRPRAGSRAGSGRARVSPAGARVPAAASGRDGPHRRAGDLPAGDRGRADRGRRGGNGQGVAAAEPPAAGTRRHDAAIGRAPGKRNEPWTSTKSGNSSG